MFWLAIAGFYKDWGAQGEGLGNFMSFGDLPSKEVLMAQIAGAINAVATKVAVGINEVPSGLARALKQVSEGEGQAS